MPCRRLDWTPGRLPARHPHHPPTGSRTVRLEAQRSQNQHCPTLSLMLAFGRGRPVRDSSDETRDPRKRALHSSFRTSSPAFETRRAAPECYLRRKNRTVEHMRAHCCRYAERRLRLSIPAAPIESAIEEAGKHAVASSGRCQRLPQSLQVMRVEGGGPIAALFPDPSGYFRSTAEARRNALEGMDSPWQN